MDPLKAHILVVEDDPAISRGLCDVLVFNGYRAEALADGIDGCRAALEGRFDLVLLDVMLPRLDGFAICRRIRRRRPTQPVIMLTAKGSEDDIVAGFGAGADDYISKPFSLRELMVRVEAVLRRSGKVAGTEQLRFGDLCFDGLNLQATCRDRSDTLTRREMDILVYLFRHRHRIVSKAELLAEVWHYKDPAIETRTVDIHLLKLKKKIAALADGGRTLIETVRGEGYRMEPER
jgi:DNA-binding response OmpR family regulator